MTSTPYLPADQAAVWGASHRAAVLSQRRGDPESSVWELAVVHTGVLQVQHSLKMSPKQNNWPQRL